MWLPHSAKLARADTTTHYIKRHLGLGWQTECSKELYALQQLMPTSLHRHAGSNSKATRVNTKLSKTLPSEIQR
jgi:hypothetical protein